MERMALAPYAMRDELTEGRQVFEPPHPYRTEFQRDRDRIIHAKAFRRLEKKTQVFGQDYSDHFRNRLTHTLEVSQISHTLAEALGLNADLCEVLALSHDIGHPPFSHAGETTLDKIMKAFGSGFDHNLHALRIVEDFEEKYASFRGLNLTFEVREGIVKHSRDFSEGEVCYVDISPYRPGQRPPLEGQLIDVADEIAYNAADLDDGYDSGLLQVRQLRRECRLFDRLWQGVDHQHPTAEEKLKVSEVIRRVINELVTSVIQETDRLLAEGAFSSVEEVRKYPERLVRFAPRQEELNREIKAFLRARLYDHEIMREGREQAQRELADLFDYYTASPQKLPTSHQARLDELGLPRVVCDYIAGMTDTFARTRHRQIIGELAKRSSLT
jgi:dGTPase